MKKYIVLALSLVFIISCDANKKKSNSKESISQAIVDDIEDDIDKAIMYYHKLKKDTPDLYNFEDENELNNLGYQLLNAGRVKEAIKIFSLLVLEFPDSFNPYDSLAEAYYIDGNMELSLKNYQKSLALNPKNINAEDWIDRIKYPTIDSTKFSKIYTQQQYKSDIDELAKRLTEVNPNSYKFVTKNDFWKLVEKKKSAINDSTTYSNFIWHCSQIIASINCSHTSMGYFNQERKMIPVELRFPLETRLVDDKLYVSNALVNSDKVNVKSEILSINGIAFQDIKKEVYKHISSQGYIETYKKNFFNSHSTSIIPYVLGFPDSYKVVLKENNQTVGLKSLKKYKNNFQKLPNYLCKERLCIKFLDDKKTALMTVRSFAYYGSKFPEYKKFIDNSFAELKTQGIKNLVIDVRYNGGGSSDAGIYLLKHITKEPFMYFSRSQFNENKEAVQPHKLAFKGNLYFTIDGNGGSTTGHFMSMVKHLELGILIGEELGSNQFCTGGQKRLRLPNTEVGYSVGRNTYVTTATSFSDEKGIMPDHNIVQNIDDYLNNIDTVLEYTMKVIKK